MFKVTVLEYQNFEGKSDVPVIVRLEQTVDLLDLKAVIDAINRKPRKSRAKNAEAK